MQGVQHGIAAVPKTMLARHPRLICLIKAKSVLPHQQVRSFFAWREAPEDTIHSGKAQQACAVSTFLYHVGLFLGESVSVAGSCSFRESCWILVHLSDMDAMIEPAKQTIKHHIYSTLGKLYIPLTANESTRLTLFVQSSNVALFN